MPSSALDHGVHVRAAEGNAYRYGVPIDFDADCRELIAPAIEAAGLETFFLAMPVR